MDKCVCMYMHVCVCACVCLHVCVCVCVYVCVCALPGLTYWRLNECDLYHPLPDSLDSGAFLFLQEDTSAVRRAVNWFMH